MFVDYSTNSPPHGGCGENEKKSFKIYGAGATLCLLYYILVWSYKKWKWFGKSKAKKVVVFAI